MLWGGGEGLDGAIPPSASSSLLHPPLLLFTASQDQNVGVFRLTLPAATGGHGSSCRVDQGQQALGGGVTSADEDVSMDPPPAIGSLEVVKQVWEIQPSASAPSISNIDNVENFLFSISLLRAMSPVCRLHQS